MPFVIRRFGAKLVPVSAGLPDAAPPDRFPGAFLRNMEANAAEHDQAGLELFQAGRITAVELHARLKTVQVSMKNYYGEEEAVPFFHYESRPVSGSGPRRDPVTIMLKADSMENRSRNETPRSWKHQQPWPVRQYERHF